LHDAAGWGLATRLARKFSGCTAEPLAGSTLTVTDDRVVLATRPAFRALVTETVEKDLRQLAGWLKLDWAIKSLG
jgi:exopolyphosphatase/guanosine-5'-triphosphate,3'-diphosphate pyrophosphatase